ncbi:hypothetical protein [Streptomyces sp. NPDC056323]|uniref:hypothetical protein n=1 Tax=unclassified Streptomyces TaxID=2593676 RepID=UPI0035D8294E
MVHTEHSRDIVQAQREWIRTYNALAEAPAGSNTRLRQRLIDLSRRLVQDVQREQLADLLSLHRERSPRPAGSAGAADQYEWAALGNSYTAGGFVGLGTRY